MRSFVPFVLVFLAIFIAACIAFIAWELSSDVNTGADPVPPDTDTDTDTKHRPPSGEP